MAKILLIDGNPEQHRALCGLLRHRTPHSVILTETRAEGIRAAYTERPDLIMINALMFIEEDFALSHTLRARAETVSVPIVVHTSGELGDLTQKRIETQGIAGRVDLPATADELIEIVKRVLERTEGSVQSVAWSSVRRKDGEGEAKKPQAVEWPRVERKEEDAARNEVRPVVWPKADRTEGEPGADEKRSKRPNQTTKYRAQSRPRPAQKRPSSEGSEDAFRKTSFKRVKPGDAKSQKDKLQSEGFRNETWPAAKPADIKNRHRKRREG